MIVADFSNDPNQVYICFQTSNTLSDRKNPMIMSSMYEINSYNKYNNYTCRCEKYRRKERKIYKTGTKRDTDIEQKKLNKETGESGGSLLL